MRAMWPAHCDHCNGRLLTAKELASLLRKNPSYVYAMRSKGFPMPAGVATLDEARRWLIRNPKPRGK